MDIFVKKKCRRCYKQKDDVADCIVEYDEGTIDCELCELCCSQLRDNSNVRKVKRPEDLLLLD